MRMHVNHGWSGLGWMALLSSCGTFAGSSVETSNTVAVYCIGIQGVSSKFRPNPSNPSQYHNVARALHAHLTRQLQHGQATVKLLTVQVSRRKLRSFEHAATGALAHAHRRLKPELAAQDASKLPSYVILLAPIGNVQSGGRVSGRNVHTGRVRSFAVHWCLLHVWAQTYEVRPRPFQLTRVWKRPRKLLGDSNTRPGGTWSAAQMTDSAATHRALSQVCDGICPLVLECRARSR